MIRSAARWPASEAAFDAALIALALSLFLAITAATGRIPVNEGQGWDGSDYAAMIEDGWDEGTANTALRPAVVLLNVPAFLLAGDAVPAFHAMNMIYAALLCYALSRLFARYNDAALPRAALVFNLFLCIAVTKIAAFYPLLVDLGSHAIVAAAVLAIVSDRRRAAALACVVGVLAREFVLAAPLLGIHRDLRMRVPVRTTVLTYVPAIVVFVAWRAFVGARWADTEGGDLVVLSRLVSHLAVWREPLFAALFVYFTATVFGGVSLYVLARADVAARHLRREPEWATFIAAVLAAAAVGEADVWRYLAYLMPAVAVLFAVCTRDLTPRGRLVPIAIVTSATLLTQRPMQAMTVQTYFRDWFPYYIHKGNVPFEPPLPELFPLWGWRLLIAVGLLWVLSTFQRQHANC